MSVLDNWKEGCKLLKSWVSPDLESILQITGGRGLMSEYLCKNHIRRDGHITVIDPFSYYWVRDYSGEKDFPVPNMEEVKKAFENLTAPMPIESLYVAPIEFLTYHHGHRNYDLAVLSLPHVKSVAVMCMSLVLGHVQGGGHVLIQDMHDWRIVEAYMIFSGMFKNRIQRVDANDAATLIKVLN